MGARAAIDLWCLLLVAQRFVFAPAAVQAVLFTDTVRWQRRKNDVGRFQYKLVGRCFVIVNALDVQSVIVFADGGVKGSTHASPVQVALHLAPMLGFADFGAIG